MSQTSEDQITGAENIVWDLSILFGGVDDPAIDADIQKARKLADEFAAKYIGAIASLSAAELAEALRVVETIHDLTGRLSSFAYFLYASDTADPKHGALLQKSTELDSAIEQTIVFLNLEWNALEEDHVKALLDDPVLADYRHHLESERRYKPYQLSEAQEQLLLEKQVTGSKAWTRFYIQLTSSMRYEFEGESLTRSEVATKRFAADREVRRKGADALNAGLRQKSMELTYVFNVLAADKATDDRLRGYPSWVSWRNLDNKAPDAVVDALIEAVTSRYGLVARHYHCKRIMLGLDELTEYDLHAPLPAKESDKTYHWDEAKEIVLTAFGAFAPQMAEIAGLFFDKNWIHAKLAPNKRSGAFSGGHTPSTNPYVFLNFTGTESDVRTLAHELGHGVHDYLSAQSNHFFDMLTPLTTAETASTFGELLVFNDLMAKENSPEAQLAMLMRRVEDTLGTIFRQITMNRFEHGMHTARREQGELTTEQLSEIWMETQHAMYGDSVHLRDDHRIRWSGIGHFVRAPGYVYAYAFGELLVFALFSIYQEEGEAFVPKYFDMLSAGGSDYPDRIMSKMGVDLNDPAFWHKGLDAISDMIDWEEKLAREVYPDRFKTDD